MSRLIYVVNARLPTEKAHGLQIAKMCEAMGRLNINIELWHPRRHQPDEGLMPEVFDYYGVDRTFTVRTLKNVDIVPLIENRTERLIVPMFSLHGVLWSTYAAALVKRAKPDVVMTRDPSLAFTLVRAGLPTIYESLLVPARLGKWFLQNISDRENLRRVIAVTTPIAARLAEFGVPEEKLIVLPDAVDLKHFRPVSDRRQLRDQLGLPRGRPIVGYVGRFQAMGLEKGIPELIESFLTIECPGERPLLLCVGGPMDSVPTYMELVRRFGLSEDDVRFVDRVPNPEVARWMQACDALTIPWRWNEVSAYFTSPLKMFEYMAAGVPIVASDLPALRDVLRDGENALLVQPGDPIALAAGLSRIFREPDLAARLAETAWTEVQDFTWDKRVVKILSGLVPHG